MKAILCIIFSFITLITDAQCVDVFGATTTCPTENDSLVVYNNALKVYEFYEKNTDYVKLKSQRLRTKQDVLNCFYQLQDAVDSFQKRWQERERVLNGEDIPSVLLSRDGKNTPMSDYYMYIDANRFYQRELENGILNTSSPFPIYDIRISPLIINSYENRYSHDEFNGDFVNIALYIPVTVKPYNMLTDSERVLRAKILEGTIPPPSKEVKIAKPVKIPVKRRVMKDTTLLESVNIDYTPPVIQRKPRFTIAPWGAIPIYGYDMPNGNWLIGYLVKRKFRKYLQTDEFYEFLPKSVKDFLNNDTELEKYLKRRFGAYYDGLLK